MSTSTDTAEVVVVGGGLEGCATAWALAERGVTDVVIVERSTVGDGGTGKSSRRRALPLRRRVPGRHGDPGAGRLRERRGGPRHGRRLPPDRLRRRRRPAERRGPARVDGEPARRRRPHRGHRPRRGPAPVAGGRPRALRRLRVGGARRVRRRVPDRAGLRRGRAACRCPAPAGHDRHRDPLGRRRGDGRGARRRLAGSTRAASSSRPGRGRCRCSPRTASTCRSPSTASRSC